MTHDAPAHGGQLHDLAARFGVPLDHLLDFSANINPDGPPPGVLEALRAALIDPATLTHYPDLDSSELRVALSQHHNLPPEAISVANGFVPLLEATLRCLNLRRCLLPVPAFGEYRKTLERTGVQVEPYPLSPEENFRYDPRRILSSLLAGGHDAILLANPQNPSGVLTPLADLMHLLEAAARHNIHVLLDEAFIDYTPQHSAGPLISRFPNLTIFRSVTKFYAIPGLRVAYVLSSPTLRSAIARTLAPWPISTLASKAAIAALADPIFPHTTIARNAARRAPLAAGLHQLGLQTYPAAANFLLLHLPPATDATGLWSRLIFDHHIVLRLCTTFENLTPGHLRLAVRTPEPNQALLEALRRTL